MDKLILEDFRCFAGRHEVPLAPLTVLVGENSSGKSSFLAAIRIAWDLAADSGIPDFNEPPFQLGAFEQIATSRRGLHAPVESFSIGQEHLADRRDLESVDKILVEGRFVRSGSQPLLAHHTFLAGSYRFSVRKDGSSPPSVSVTTPEGLLDLPWDEFGFFDEAVRRLGLGDIVTGLAAMSARRAVGGKSTHVPDAVRGASIQLADWQMKYMMARPHAFAPVRSRPQRTYDPVMDVPDPEGRHAPMVLDRLLGNGEGAGAELGKTLAEFGEASGLFSQVDVHRFGGGSDPFQVRVELHGGRRNLIDVGYGVSQALPILVEIATRPAGSTFLIQQPEVHLHPRAQAALATVFARLVKERGCRLIVETHSDYFIDRLRMCVRDEQHLASDDVRLLYFELGKAGSTIYPLTLDKRGNVLDAPPTYRRFFLDEERRFFGGA